MRLYPGSHDVSQCPLMEEDGQKTCPVLSIATLHAWRMPMSRV